MKRENNPIRKKSRRRISAGKKRNKRTPILTALLLLMVCAATFGGFTVARYALSQTGKSGLASAEEFYFTSDLLKEEGASYDVYNWGDGIPIQLKNYEDSLRYNVKDISYTVTCVPECTVTDNGNTTNGNKILGGNANSIEIKVKPTDLTKTQITVTVETSSPYKKTLEATFTATGKLQPKYQITDSSGEPTAELILTGGAKKSDITLSWDNTKIMPDRTNKYLSFDSNTCVITAEASASYRILLFKTDPDMNYSKQSNDIIGLEVNLD